MNMAQKTLLFLGISLSIVLAGIAVLPALSFEVSLATSPKRDSFYVPAGKPFNITCKGSGDGAVKFDSLKWLNKNGEVIPIGIPGTQEIETNSLTLTFDDPKEDESGVYKCTAVYKKTQTLQKSVSIIFHGNKPFFDVSFENVTVVENLYLEIPCTAEGDSLITYEWYNENEEKITSNSDSDIYVSDQVNASVLTISKVTSKHSGMYTCLASNSHGLSSKIFQLMVTSGNDTSGITSFREALAVNITATSVKFDLDVTGPVKKFKVQYYEAREGVQYFKDFNYGDDYEIKNLVPAGRYNFKFRIYPSVDETNWSRFYTVILLPEKPEVIFRTIDSGNINLEWLFKFEDRMRKTIDKHEIRYFSVQMQNGNSWKPSSCATTIQVPECSSSSYLISGLGRNVYYEIQLRAHTPSGYGEPYTQKVFFK